MPENKKKPVVKASTVKKPATRKPATKKAAPKSPVIVFDKAANPINWQIFAIAAAVALVHALTSKLGGYSVIAVVLVTGFVYLASDLKIERWIPTFTNTVLTWLGVAYLVADERAALIPFLLALIVARLSIVQKPHNQNTRIFAILYFVTSLVGALISVLMLVR